MMLRRDTADERGGELPWRLRFSGTDRDGACLAELAPLAEPLLVVPDTLIGGADRGATDDNPFRDILRTLRG
jgi:hypothetical protein